MFDRVLNKPLDVVTAKKPVEKSLSLESMRERTTKYDTKS